MSDASVLDRRVLVLAPTGCDAELTCALLNEAKIPSASCADVRELVREAERGAGLLIVVEEILGPATVRALAEMLGRQGSWSDLPILLFTGQSLEGKRPGPSVISLLGNVTLLDRPVRPITMISSVRAALRGRQQQYRAREELESQALALKHRDQFLAMLGHELRNPLNAISMAVELGDKRGGGPSKERDIIRRQTRHLARLVDDLLDVSRVTAGKIELRRAPLDLLELVQRCLTAMDATFKEQQLTVNLVTLSERYIVDGDLVRLEQIFSNILTNAVKYTPPRGAITVTFSRTGGCINVEIADSGVGIAAEMLPQIFDLFAQAKTTIDRAKGGMGIGLTLVRGLVELHGGTVEAKSEGLGFGSTFVVRLPPAPEIAVRTHEDAPAPAAAPQNILIVEDNDDSREMLQRLLRDQGHSVASVADGLSAVEHAIQQKPRVLVVDIGLPGLDGYNVARRMREVFGEDIYLIALSGYGQPEDRRRATEAGFDVHLTKPIEVGALEEILSRLTAA